MAVLRESALAPGLTGSLAGATFRHSRSGLVLQRRTQQVGQGSPQQLERRAALQTLSRNWKNLSTAERTAWANAALNNTVVNRSGQRITLTGYQLYLACSLPLYSITFALYTEPPAHIANIPWLAVSHWGGTTTYSCLCTLAASGSTDPITFWYRLARSYALKTYSGPYTWSTWMAQPGNYSAGHTFAMTASYNSTLGVPLDTEAIAADLFVFRTDWLKSSTQRVHGTWSPVP